jgi:hypothetical protein
MTDIDDLYEPGDDREPGEPDVEPQLDLDAVEESIRVYYGGSDDDSGKAAEELLMVVSRLAAELREARERIAEWEALPTREEWTVTGGRESSPDPANHLLWGGAAEKAADYAAKYGVQMWRRVVSVRPAEPIDLDAPF